MIAISTGSLIGLLADVVWCVPTRKRLPHLQYVVVEWDAQATMLHAMATDVARLAWASWHPGDELTDVQEALWSERIIPGPSWRILIALEEVRELLGAFKLPKKEHHTRLTVAMADGQLTIQRAESEAHSTLTMVIEEQAPEVAYPDLRARLAAADTIGQTSTIAYDLDGIADFARVRGGEMSLTFTSAEGQGLTLVTIGRRFVGAVKPAPALVLQRAVAA